MGQFDTLPFYDLHTWRRFNQVQWARFVLLLINALMSGKQYTIVDFTSISFHNDVSQQDTLRIRSHFLGLSKGLQQSFSKMDNPPSLTYSEDSSLDFTCEKAPTENPINVYEEQPFRGFEPLYILDIDVPHSMSGSVRVLLSLQYCGFHFLNQRNISSVTCPKCKRYMWTGVL